MSLSWQARARPKQVAPKEFTCWLIQTGRGWGKNETGSNTVIDKIKKGVWKHTALVGATTADVRDMMIDPDRKNSGIFRCVTSDFYPKYEPSKRQIVWPNGAVCTAYSAEDADQLRGPTHDSYWADELAAWKPSEREQTWSNLQFTLRAGASQGIVTTTPRPISILKTIIRLPGTVVTRGSTYENIHHLSKTYIETIIKPYEGTQKGRQELEGELLEENEMMLFDIATVDANRIMNLDEVPELQLLVVSIDPTGSETGHGVGITVGGRANGIGYLLADRSLDSASPNTWAKQAIDAFDEFDANYVVVETNFGGEMVANTIRLVAQSENHPPVPIKEIHSSRGKTIRAEPVSGLCQQGRIKHCGEFSVLEDQLYALESGQNNDRADSYVFTFTDLLGNAYKRIKPKAGNAKAPRRDVEHSSSLIGNLWNKRF